MSIENVEMQAARQRYRELCNTADNICSVLPNRVTYEMGFAQLVKPCGVKYTYKQDVECNSNTRMECKYHFEEVQKIAKRLTEKNSIQA